MTRKEAEGWLHAMMWLLVDAGHTGVAMEVEDAYNRLYMGMSASVLKRWSYHAVGQGKRGHVTLVLQSPYDARALAMLVGILRSLDDFPGVGIYA